MIHVVGYDITDDRRRYHVARVLADFGTRVQFSVFECILDRPLLLELQQRLAALELPPEDSIRIYPLCQRCGEHSIVIGVGELTQDVDFYMV